MFLALKFLYHLNINCYVKNVPIVMEILSQEKHNKYRYVTARINNMYCKSSQTTSMRIYEESLHKTYYNN